MDLGEKLKLIERLGRLHAEGALSDAEFAAEKARLLGGGGIATEAPKPAATEPDPANQHPVIEEPADQPAYGKPDERGTARLINWGAGAAVVIAVLGGGFWLGQIQAGPPADALVGNGSVAATSSPAKAITRAQLVGAWTPDESCISDSGFDLYADGTVGYEDGSGRWSIEDGKLVTDDDSGRSATAIQSLSGDTLSLRYADGSVTRFRRCSPAQVAAAKRAAEADAVLTAAGQAVENAGAAVEAASDETFTADEQRAIDAYNRLNSACRGGSGDEQS
ncbi:MAG TPA: SHOCT domain-containing protein, partial [Sphingomicrobium sp.]